MHKINSYIPTLPLYRYAIISFQLLRNFNRLAEVSLLALLLVVVIVIVVIRHACLMSCLARGGQV